MFCNGMKIKDLAEKREIKEGTVWKHLINLIKHKQISVSQVLANKKIKLITNKKVAAIQKGTATLVRKSNGIPTRVIPIIESNAIMPKQILWQT